MVRLGDVCKKASSNIAQKDLACNEGEYPIYGASGFIKNVDFYKQDKQYIAIVKDGAGIGRAMILPSCSSVIGTLQYILPEKAVDVRYLYYAIASMNLAKYFSGATIPHIYFKDYQKELLPLPSQNKQIEIADIFDSISELISLRKQQLEQLDLLVKSMFVEMFGDLMTNPMGWEVYEFEKLCLLITDGEHATPRRTNQGIYLLSARNILNHKIRLDDVDFIDEEEYNRIARRVVPQENDILISCSGSIGRCCRVPNDIKFQMVRSAALLRFKPMINPVFAEYLITSDDLQRQIQQSATQSSQANLFQGKIRKLRAIVPHKELQNEFADFVRQTDKSKFEIQQGLKQLELQYNALMQQYFG